MREWHAELGGFRLTARYRALLGLDLPDQRDSLGLVYQSLLREGDKAAGGSYYTPDRIVRAIADETYRHGARVLDPCCGTGTVPAGIRRQDGRSRRRSTERTSTPWPCAWRG